MEHFAFSNTLTNLRKQRGITQEQVANFLGVTKAAVSKWETGQSLPDITLLPKLATYFNLSIDELLGYKPQMTKEQIQALYSRLAADFTKKEFQEVYEEILSICDEYYACFPLLMQMAVLLLNYVPQAGDKKPQVIDKIFSLCARIEEESHDVKLLRQAQSIKAYCHLMMNEPDKVLELLGDIELYTGNDILIATSFQMLGNVEKAKETMQVSMFQNVISILSNASNYLLLNVSEPDYYQMIVERMERFIDTFELEAFHFNSAIMFYLSAAQGFAMQQNFDEAARMIQKYCSVCQKVTFPLTLHGDEFFNMLDEWILKEIDLGKSVPRDEASIKASILQGIEANPVFAPLLEREDVRMALLQLKHHLGGI